MQKVNIFFGQWEQQIEFRKNRFRLNKYDSFLKYFL